MSYVPHTHATTVAIIETEVLNSETIELTFHVSFSTGKQIRKVEVNKSCFDLLNLGEVQDFWCDYTCKVSYEFVPYEFGDLSESNLCNLAKYHLPESEIVEFSDFTDNAPRKVYERYLDVCGLPYKNYATEIRHDLPLPSKKYTSQKQVFRSGCMLYVKARTKHEATLLFQDFVGVYEIQDVKLAFWAN